MESILLTIIVVMLYLDREERRAAGYGDQARSVRDVAERDEGRIRSLTDRAVVHMMNEIRRAQSKEL